MPFTKIIRKRATRPVPVTVGEHIKEARITRGLLQREVAELLGVAAATVANWENGKTDPLPKDGPKIVQFLGYLPLPVDTLAEQLMALRFMNGWTQAQAGAACGVSEDSWATYEGGSTPASSTLENVRAWVRQVSASPPDIKTI